MMKDKDENDRKNQPAAPDPADATVSPDDAPPRPGRERVWTALDAGSEVMRIPSTESPPIPVRRPGGLAFSVLVGSFRTSKVTGRESALEPDSYFTVDARSFRVLDVRELPPRDGKERAFIGETCSMQWCQLLDRHRRALLTEYHDLCDYLGTAWIEGSLSDRDRANAKRFHKILHFFLTGPMLYFVQLISPEFCLWLSEVSGEPFGQPIYEPPEPRLDCDSGPPRVLERPRPGRDREKTPDSPPPFLLNDEELRSAYTHFGLAPKQHSALAGLTPAPSESNSRAAADFSAPLWREALDALCDPQWIVIESFLASDGRVLSYPYYLPRHDREPLWVGHRKNPDGLHRIDFPVYPEVMIRHAKYALRTYRLDADESETLRLSGQELAVLASMAESLKSRGKTGPVTLGELRAAWMRPAQEGSMTWPYLVRAFSPLFPPPGQDPIPGGIATLVMRGLLEGNPARPRAGAAMAKILERLGHPDGGHALAFNQLDDKTGLALGGISAVQTTTNFWVLDRQPLGPPPKAPGQPRLALFTCSTEKWVHLMEEIVDRASFKKHYVEGASDL